MGQFQNAIMFVQCFVSLDSGQIVVWKDRDNGKSPKIESMRFNCNLWPREHSLLSC